jgi:hypothetical protein
VAAIRSIGTEYSNESFAYSAAMRSVKVACAARAQDACQKNKLLETNTEVSDIPVEDFLDDGAYSGAGVLAAFDDTDHNCSSDAD